MAENRLDVIVEKMKKAIEPTQRHCVHCGHELYTDTPAFTKEEIEEVRGYTGERTRKIDRTDRPDRPDRPEGELTNFAVPAVSEALDNPEWYARRLIQIRKRYREQ